MSYKKAMKYTGAKHYKKQKLGSNSRFMGFSVLEKNERRRRPLLGSTYYDFSLGRFESEEEMDKAREKYILLYQQETERMLKENPNLIIVE